MELLFHVPLHEIAVEHTWNQKTNFCCKNVPSFNVPSAMGLTWWMIASMDRPERVLLFIRRTSRISARKSSLEKAPQYTQHKHMYSINECDLPRVAWIKWRQLFHNSIKTWCLLALIICWGSHRHGSRRHHSHWWHGKALQMWRRAWHSSHHPANYSNVRWKYEVFTKP